MTTPAVPELYADGVQFGVTPFTVLMAFTMQPAAAAPNALPLGVANLRMSPEHAKVMAILLRKQLKGYETQVGAAIPLHPALYQQLGISRQEDW